jgi:hypothetical protein
MPPWSWIQDAAVRKYASEHPPAVGRDTIDILRELGCSEPAISGYLDTAVVIAPACANLSNRTESE